MAVVAVALCVVLSLIFLASGFLDMLKLREETLLQATTIIGRALNRGGNPAAIPIYRDYPQSYGFRVFDRRMLAHRRLLASANMERLKKAFIIGQGHPVTADTADLLGEHKNLEEDFKYYDPPTGSPLGNDRVYILQHRIVLDGHKYWMEAFMQGDPAWVSASLVAKEFFERFLWRFLIVVPTLTIAIFLSTRRALSPLQDLTNHALCIASGRVGVRRRAHTEIKIREFSELVAANDAMFARLQKSIRSQKEFVANAAHELRTSLSILLLELGQLPANEGRERLKRDVTHLSDFLDELLYFAQADELLAAKTESIDIGAVARKVSTDAAMTALSRNQLIEFHATNAHASAMGNLLLVEMAIRNLVDNALKYSPPNTTTTVTVEDGPKVVVEDCGPGIPLSERREMFRRFWRAQPGSEKGAGIGLALVLRVAELHNGQIWYEDRPAGGSRFVLSLANGADDATVAQSSA